MILWIILLKELINLSLFNLNLIRNKMIILTPCYILLLKLVSLWKMHLLFYARHLSNLQDGEVLKNFAMKKLHSVSLKLLNLLFWKSILMIGNLIILVLIEMGCKKLVRHLNIKTISLNYILIFLALRFILMIS